VHRIVFTAGLAVLSLLVGCTDPPNDETANLADGAPPRPPLFEIDPERCEPGTLKLDDGSCRAAGVEDWGCAPGELPLADGGCLAPGIPSDGCGEGFSSDGNGGCEPELPSQDCVLGMMALPGETSCRAVAPCGSGTWGDIVTDGSTQHVDLNHTGSSDGSATNPFKSIQAAVDAAAPGAVIAIAEGKYVEKLVLSVPLALWGRCPALVEIVGTDAPAVQLDSGASGTTIRALAVTGNYTGVFSDAAALTLDATWIHDTGFVGLDVRDVPNSDAAVIVDSLIENTTGNAVQAIRASLEIVDSVVRDTRPLANGGFGRAIFLQELDATDLTLLLQHSIVERQRMAALITFGADMHVIDSLVRDTEAVLADGTIGYAAVVAPTSSAHFEGSVLERSSTCGICAVDADLSIERTVIRDVEAEPATQLQGQAVYAATSMVETAVVLTVDQSLVERSHLAGIMGETVDMTVRSTIVRDVVPQLSDDVLGHGIHYEKLREVAGAQALIEGCLVQRATEAGVFNGAGDMELAHSHVIDMLAHQVQPTSSGYGVLVTSFPPQGLRGQSFVHHTVVERSLAAAFAVVGTDASFDSVIASDTRGDQYEQFGYGVAVQPHLGDGARADVSIFGSLVERARTAGIVVQGSDGLIEATLVRDTLPQPSDGDAAGGVVVQGELLITNTEAFLDMRGSVVDNNAGSGVLVLAAEARLEGIAARDGQARPSDDDGGIGVVVQSDLVNGTRARLTLLHSLLERNVESGILVQGAEAVIDDVVVLDTRYRSGEETFGDGIEINVPFDINDQLVSSSAIITRARIVGSPRAGIGNFGGFVEVGDSVFECNAIHLDSEEQTGEGYGFDNLGGNVCGCDGMTVACKVLSSGLQAPGLY
jgi:hypothetical protein